MTFSAFTFGLIRHTGYALLLSGGAYLGIEAFIPGFVTPYLNPYILLILGLTLAVLGAWRVTSTLFGRWVMGLSFIGLLLVAVFTQFTFQNATAWLMFGACLLIVAFFVASVYPEEV